MANPFNVRLHPKNQQDVLLDVLQTIGLVQDVIVNRTTGHVVDGHMRVTLAIREGVPAIPVKYVDLTADEELVVLHTFDPLSALAAYDRDLLAEAAPGVLGTVASRPALASFYEELVARNAPKELSFAVQDGNGAGNYNAPVDGVDIVEGLDDSVSSPPPSHVRMVQLFLTVASHPVFMVQASALMSAWGLDNVTDVVAKAIADAYAVLPDQVIDDGDTTDDGWDDTTDNNEDEVAYDDPNEGIQVIR